jgi:hypothetical protein
VVNQQASNVADDLIDIGSIINHLNTVYQLLSLLIGENSIVNWKQQFFAPFANSSSFTCHDAAKVESGHAK